MLKNWLSKLILFSFLTFTFSIPYSFAEIKYKLSSGESGLTQNSSTDCDPGFFCIKEQTAGNFLQNAFNLAVGISISVAVLMLIFQGTALLLAEYGIGQLASNSVLKAQSKTDLLNPILGLIIVFCAVIVIRTLNPDLLNFQIFDKLNFSVQNTNTGGSGTISNGG